ncbi:bifunctional hydroxymethylpyrimidine kinase/phosphomethylpyrimidine kinase [Virgisporangium aliadipatigenens]|uniref:bifunctional hydroxymethylpyrimidine kinase/phosphomethylpyrimidine kinase n=1 Tax=Virgisporangium aliadipatigenens TaxID=741659 RepID=UPI001941765F|nr:bifunctional hydroxymethylpyrimidine kinase/phosphomethylpyrimidine kinase [Virgisporangium aliadipatigenens]
MTPPVVLTVGGSDCSGGSGVQADLKTLLALRVYGASAVTTVGVQNTRAAATLYAVPAEVLAGQLTAVLDDLPVLAVKTGLFPSADAVAVVTGRARSGGLPNLVVDPVLPDEGQGVSRRAVAAALDRLLPYALVATPNRDEASALLGWQVATPGDMARAAEELAARGPKCVVVTGGDLVTGTEALDAVWAGGEFRYMSAPRVAARNTRGSGDVFATAVAARLALGDGLLDALAFAKGLVARAISDAAGWRLGVGRGPLDVFGWSAG